MSLTTILRIGSAPWNGDMTTYLIIGGAGKTGRRIADRLTARGETPRLASRSSRPAFDWNADPDTWTAVLDGIDAAYVSYYPDLAFPGAAESIRAFAERAAASGVRRLVLLSGRGEEEAEISERGVTESGVDWTVLRCNWFAQDFSEHFLLPPVLDGVIALPTDVPEPFVDVEDVADVAVAALTGDGHAGRVYVLSGPRAVTFREAAADITAASGRPVRFERVTPEECTRRLVAAGMDRPEAEELTDLFARVLDGRNVGVSDDVKRVTGHDARDFADYVRRTAATGVWAP
jgi:uncharacterized protein YbjT (DUF2867 family)